MKDVEDLEAFRRWAIGNLLENRTRGLYAEWIVGRALGVVDPNQPRREWDASDLTYRDRLIEVKASGRGQAWPQDKPSTIRFGISPSKRPWFADSNTWVSHREAERVADLYVFCLHDVFPASDADAVDLATWKFWVVPTFVLNGELGSQKSVGPARLDDLTRRIAWTELQGAVDAVLNQLAGEERRRDA